MWRALLDLYGNSQNGQGAAVLTGLAALAGGFGLWVAFGPKPRDPQ